MTNTFLTAKEIRAILATVPDDQMVFIAEEHENVKEGHAIASYTLHRYSDGNVEITFFTDGNCGLEF